MNEHIQITPGAILFKNIPWSSELQQHLKTTLHLRDNLVSSSWGYLLKHGYNRCYRIVAFEWMSERCTPPRLTVGPSVLKLKGALHSMNMGDKLNIIDEANTFIFAIWFNKIRGIHWEEHWVYNKELFYYKLYKLWDACLDDLAVPRRLVITYTWRVFVSTWGKFMTDWQSWWLLARCAQSLKE